MSVPHFLKWYTVKKGCFKNAYIMLQRCCKGGWWMLKASGMVVIIPHKLLIFPQLSYFFPFLSLYFLVFLYLFVFNCILLHFNIFCCLFINLAFLSHLRVEVRQSDFWQIIFSPSQAWRLSPHDGFMPHSISELGNHHAKRISNSPKF